MDYSCLNCIHHNKEEWSTCKAFPKGIPYEIISGEFNHIEEHPDDKDIRFEPIQKEKK